jgi:tRNA pseudouridine32 synthase/23S rRNA pseudouridine746 synthase
MPMPPFTLIFQDEHIVVIDKAPNISFHDEDDQIGLANMVKQAVNDSAPESKLYPVHRLDKMTSGLLIFARTLATAQALGELFNKHEIEKYYIAISDKKPSKKQGLIKGDMEKARRGSWKLCKTLVNPAITQFFSYSLNNGLRAFLLKPHSGKTHQLRVALKSIGAPIIGDARYHEVAEAEKWDRGYLHAYALRFTVMHKDYQFVCNPLIGDYYTNAQMASLLKEIALPWEKQWPQIKK